MGGSLPFRSGVVVSLRPPSVCHGSLWLVTAPFPYLVAVRTSTHLLLASSAASPGVLGVLPCFPYDCAHTCCWAWSFLCFLPALRPPSGSGYTGSSAFSSLLGFPTFAMGSPLRGRGLFVLDRNESLVSSIWVRSTSQFLTGPPNSVCGYLHTLSLRVCCQVVLAVSFTFGFP